MVAPTSSLATTSAINCAPADIRADFTAFCEQRNWAFANWRQAWVAFMGAQPALQPAPQPTFVPIEFPLPAPAQPIPLWRQRSCARATPPER